MSELPQASDLPHAGEGYDPARVEEAFAAFAERVHELELVAAELRDELRALRAERASVPARADDESWPLDPAGHVSPDWVGAVPPPLDRRPAVPRLALEGLFLLAVALLAGLANLAAVWIVVVMAVAWALVALAEWAAAAKRARWRLDEIAAPLDPGEASEDTGPWDMPVVEATAVESAPDAESATIVAAALPVAGEAEADEPVEAEPEPEPQPEAAPGPEAEQPRRRLLRLRRKRPAEAATKDPWET